MGSGLRRQIQISIWIFPKVLRGLNETMHDEWKVAKISMKMLTMNEWISLYLETSEIFYLKKNTKKIPSKDLADDEWMMTRVTSILRKIRLIADAFLSSIYSDDMRRIRFGAVQRFRQRAVAGFRSGGRQADSERFSDLVPDRILPAGMKCFTHKNGSGHVTRLISSVKRPAVM